MDKNISGPSGVKCWDSQSAPSSEQNGRKEAMVRQGRVITADCGDESLLPLHLLTPNDSLLNAYPQVS